MRIEYTGTPPPSFVSNVNQAIASNHPPHWTVNVTWSHTPAGDEPEPIDQSQYQGIQTTVYCIGTIILCHNVCVARFRNHPRGYRQNPHFPVLCGQNFCPYCLCSPCVIALPPDFLRGSSGPHPANDEKRHRLYRLFWRLLKDLGLWRDDEYIQRKELRTTRDDKRDIIPKCVIMVIIYNGSTKPSLHPVL